LIEDVQAQVQATADMEAEAAEEEPEEEEEEEEGPEEIEGVSRVESSPDSEMANQENDYFAYG